MQPEQTIAPGAALEQKENEAASVRHEPLLVGWVRFVYLPTKRVVIDRARAAGIGAGDWVEVRSSVSDFETSGEVSLSITDEYFVVEIKDTGNIMEGDEVFKIKTLSPENLEASYVEKEEN